MTRVFIFRESMQGKTMKNLGKNLDIIEKNYTEFYFNRDKRDKSNICYKKQNIFNRYISKQSLTKSAKVFNKNRKS